MSVYLQSMKLSQHKAIRMGHNFVGTEQILLGMLADGENAAAHVLTQRAITLEDARHEIEQVIR